jgi:hypothetical protein
MSQLYTALSDMPLLRSKSKGKGMMAWQVSFVGEGGDDYGGLFRESIRELAADLQVLQSRAPHRLQKSPTSLIKEPCNADKRAPHHAEEPCIIRRRARHRAQKRAPATQKCPTRGCSV